MRSRRRMVLDVLAAIIIQRYQNVMTTVTTSKLLQHVHILIMFFLIVHKQDTLPIECKVVD